MRGRSGHVEALPKTGRISALASRRGAYERVTKDLQRQDSLRLKSLVTSSPLKAALFRASGPERRGFSGRNGGSVYGFWREGDPPLAVGGSKFLSGAAAGCCKRRPLPVIPVIHRFYPVNKVDPL